MELGRHTRQQDHHHCRALNSKIVLIVMPLYECFSLFVDSAESSVQNQCDSLPANPTKQRTRNEPARFAAALFVSPPVDIFRVKSKQKIMCVSLGGN